MTTQERINQLERELQTCDSNIQQWTIARHRTEGALLLLQTLLKEEEEAAKQEMKEPEFP